MNWHAFTHGIIPLSMLLLLTTPYSVLAQSSSAYPNGEPVARVTPSMAIIIVVLISALFFMGFFSIYIRHCNDTNGGSVRPLGGVGRSRRAAVARGLDAAVIETFPTLEYSAVKGLKIGKSALECAVCLCEFEDDEKLRLLPKCDHVFHPDCIDAWLASHTTCPVCRADLTPQPGDPVPQPSESHPESPDLEAQNDAVELEPENCDDGNVAVEAPEPEVMSVNQTLNRNRTRGSRSGRPRKFPRSHSTGHSLVQPGENTERFTLRLPVEVRKQIMDRKLNRARSVGVLPREGSSRRGYRTGGEGSSRGKVLNYKRLEKSKSDLWNFSRTPSFLARASSFLMRTSSVKSPKGVATEREGTSTRPVGPGETEPGRPPV